MTQHCNHCNRKRPEYIADPSCRMGGYCEWSETMAVSDCLNNSELPKALESAFEAATSAVLETGMVTRDLVSAYPASLLPLEGRRTVDCCHGINSPICLSPGLPGHEPRCAWSRAGDGEVWRCELQAEHGGFHLYQPVPRAVPMEAFWQTPRVPGQPGQILFWQFQGKAIVESFEVEGQRTDGLQGRDFNGYITSLRVGNEELLRLGPYPISMFSPGMPKVDALLPFIPVGVGLTITLDYFIGRIRPTGLVVLGGGPPRTSED